VDEIDGVERDLLAKPTPRQRNAFATATDDDPRGANLAHLATLMCVLLTARHRGADHSLTSSP